MKSSIFAARAGRPRHGFVRLAIAASVLAACGAASADDAERVDTPPPLADIVRDIKPLVKSAEAAKQAATTPASVAATYGLPEIAPHEAKLELDIEFTTSRIYNPGTGVYDTVKLRSYRGTGVDPKIPFVAPQIQIQPGETVRITLDNKLPKEPNCKPPNINTPHCFNSTNLHSHGLWVSPTGNSDNVLLTIRPGVSFQYEYNIPADHPSGTFWYHPHLHGSTALQVASGMAGVLVVRGSRFPEPTKNGDIDTLLTSNVDGTRLKERVVEFQQVQYACRDKAGAIKVKKDANGKVIAWVCDPGDTGEITSYDQFPPSSWTESGRYTSINGEVLPTFPEARTGTIERWRTVHAGIRNTINLQFKKLKVGAPSFDRLAAADADAWAAANCEGDPLPQFEIATDGLTHTQVIQKTQNTLQPGYRSDVLMVFPEPGDYCVIDAAAPATSTINALSESRQLLGKVRVSKAFPVPADVKKYLTDQLSILAERTQRPDMRTKIKADLANNLHLDAFVPHPTIETKELTPPGGVAQTVEFDIGGTPTEFRVNGKPYNPDTARQLVLGRVEEWELSSKVANHPFHIHVNPFEVDRILNLCDEDVSGTTPDYSDIKTKDDCKDPSKRKTIDPQYADTKGVWKDTLFVKQGYKLYVRTRYERYIGEYVLHCHILDHEDQGMMQNIRMVLPDGEGGGIIGHH